jgi:hypothetical protein
VAAHTESIFVFGIWYHPVASGIEPPPPPVGVDCVVPDTTDEGVETLPAASTAVTRYEYVVLALNPMSV